MHGEEVMDNDLFTGNTLAAQLFAEVIIPLALPQNYTWAIPAHLQENV